MGFFCRSLSDREGGRRDVAVLVMEEIQEDGSELLGNLHEHLRRRDGSFRPWFFAAVRYIAISFVRAHPENRGAGAPAAGALVAGDRR